jgi:hypothetical protein
MFVLLNAPLSAWLSRLQIPAGDVIVPITALSMQLIDIWRRSFVYPLTRSTFRLASWWSAATAPHIAPFLSRVSVALESWGGFGVCLALLAATLFLLLTG